MTDTTIQPPLVEPFALVGVPPQITAQLQAAITQAMAPLLSEIATLKEENAALVDRLTALEGLSAPPIEDTTGEVHLPQQVHPEPDKSLCEDIIRLRADMEMLNESRAVEIAEDRSRLRALEVPVPTPTPKTTGHLDRLDREMKGSRIRQVSFAHGARILGLSSSRLRQLKPLILEDRRFTIVKDPHHSQRLLIRTNFWM